MASPLVDVYVKLPSGRTSTIALMPADKVSKICEHVGKEEGVPGDHVRLKYQGKMVDKTKTIGYLGIRPETILKGEVVVPKNLSLYLKFDDGHTLSMTARNVDKVVDIRKYIQEMEGIHFANIMLKVSGRNLCIDYQLIYEAGIGDEAVLEVSLINKPKAPEEVVEKKDEIPEQLKEDVLASFDTGGKNVEVVFCFDTTGSMSSYLHEVRNNIKDTCRRLLQDIPGIRIGIMAHGDYCDQHNYVVRSADLTSDVDQLKKFTTETPDTCGGDSPECYEWALREAQQLDWSEDSAKAFVMIGDCEPHPPSYTDQNIHWRDELNVLIGMGVKVYGVYCRSYGSDAEHFYAEMAEKSGGCLLKLAHFNLITEMFLAVCYREAAPEQLEAYTEELEEKGQLVGDTKELMAQLDTKTPEGRSTPTKARYVAEAWWDVSRDKGIPEYIYDTVKDHWSRKARGANGIVTTTSVTTSASSSRSITTGSSSKRKKIQCVIM